jgi:hypothetical protein
MIYEVIDACLTDSISQYSYREVVAAVIYLVLGGQLGLKVLPSNLEIF